MDLQTLLEMQEYLEKLERLTDRMKGRKDLLPTACADVFDQQLTAIEESCDLMSFALEEAEYDAQGDDWS